MAFSSTVVDRILPRCRNVVVSPYFSHNSRHTASSVRSDWLVIAEISLRETCAPILEPQPSGRSLYSDSRRSDTLRPTDSDHLCHKCDICDRIFALWDWGWWSWLPPNQQQAINRRIPLATEVQFSLPVIRFRTQRQRPMEPLAIRPRRNEQHGKIRIRRKLDERWDVRPRRITEHSLPGPRYGVTFARKSRKQSILPRGRAIEREIEATIQSVEELSRRPSILTALALVMVNVSSSSLALRWVGRGRHCCPVNAETITTMRIAMPMPT